MLVQNSKIKMKNYNSKFKNNFTLYTLHFKLDDRREERG